MILQDTFTEGSNTSLPSHTPEVGGTWSVGSGTFTVYEATDSVGADGREFAWNDASFSSADAYTAITGRTGGTGATQQFGGCGRSTAFGRNNASANRYWFYIDGDGGVFLQKEVAGSSSQLGSSSTIASFSTTTDYLCRLEMNGDAITLDVDGVEKVSATDTAITVSGFAGLYNRNTTTPRITLIEADILGAAADPEGPLIGGKLMNSGLLIKGVLIG